MSPRLRATFGLLVLLAAGCSTVEDTAVPPAELTDYEPAARLVTQWERGIGSAFTRKWVRLAPAVQDDSVYAANFDGIVGAFALDDGDARWQVDLDQWLSAGVGVDGERVYVGTVEGDVIALDRDNGREVWRHAAGGEQLAAPGNGTPLLVPGGVVVGLDNGRVIALAAANGQVIWETEVAPPEGRSPIERMVDIDGALDVGRNVLYAATYQGQVAQIEPQQGRVGWSRETSSYFGLHVDDQRLYLTDADSHVNALAQDDGTSLWRQEKLDHRRITAPVPVTGTSWLAVADFDGYVHLLARADGRIVARRDVDDFGILADPVPAGDGRFLVQTQGAQLMLLRAEGLD